MYQAEIISLIINKMFTLFAFSKPAGNYILSYTLKKFSEITVHLMKNDNHREHRGHREQGHRVELLCALKCAM